MSDTREALSDYINPKLTDWSNEPKLADLKADLTEAMGDHDVHTANVETWLDNLNVEGGAKIAKVKGRSSVVPKLIRKQAEWRYAALSEPFLSTPDMFECEPVTYEDVKAAEQNELVLNNQFNTKIGKVNFIDEYVRTAVDEGTVVVRVGWQVVEEEVEVPKMVTAPVTDANQANMILQAMQMAVENPDSINDGSIPNELLDDMQATAEAGGVPHQVYQDGTEMEMKQTVNQPTVDVCEYNACIIDPSCKGDVEKANFVIYMFQTSLSKLKREGKYKNLDKIQVESNAVRNVDTGTDRDSTDFQFRDEPRKQIIAYEYWGYWDKDGDGMVTPIKATWVGDTLIEMIESPFRDGKLPFVKVQYLPKRKAIYGEPDGALLEDNQKISGAVTRGMLDILGRTAQGQRGMRMDALDITNQRRFESGADYYFQPQIDPRSAFYTHTFDDIPRSAEFMLNLQNLEAESLTGVKAFSGGISGEGLGRSATAARSALSAAAKRELGILRRLADGMVQIGRKVMAMNAEFLAEEEIVRITNDEFVAVKRDDLAGNIDIRLSISTAESDNAKAEELAFMLQTIGPNSDPGEVRMIRAEIARLRKMPELAKRIESYQPEPDPFQIEMQKLEIEEKRALIEKLRSEAGENQAEATLDLAKARETESKADALDLGFVEQESGVTQERALERQGAQADANLEKSIVEHALKGGNDAPTSSGTTTS